MDKNLTKILNGLQGARDLMNELITPEIRAQMTEEELAQVDEANRVSSKEYLKRKTNIFGSTIKKR